MSILSLPSHVDIVAVGVMQEHGNIQEPRLMETSCSSTTNGFEAQS